MLLSLFLSFVAYLALRCVFNPVNWCDLFTSHSPFIVFCERDITSESHGTPVHISTTVYTLNFFQSLLSVALLLSLVLILCKKQGRRNWQLICTRWEQSYLLLCAGSRQLRRWHLLVSLASYWFDNLGIFTEGNLLLSTSKLPLGVTNKESWPLCIKQISGAVAGDSSLQDRWVAHYLLPLLFSLVSLPFSFYFCVPNQKYQKYLLPCQ